MESEGCLKALIVPTAIVEKDRTGVLTGQTIPWPSFENLAKPLLGLLGTTQAALPTGGRAEADWRRVDDGGQGPTYQARPGQGPQGVRGPVRRIEAPGGTASSSRRTRPQWELSRPQTQHDHPGGPVVGVFSR